MSAAREIYFHRELQRQTSLAGAALLLAESAQALGWDLAAFHSDIDEPDLPRASNGELIAIRMGWSAKTVTEWVTARLGRSCPVARHCARVTEPFRWECIEQELPWRGSRLVQDERRVLHVYGNDIRGAVTVPVHRTNGKTGYVSWCSRDRERLRTLHDETLGSIHLLAHTFMHRIEHLMADRVHAVPGSPPVIPDRSCGDCGRSPPCPLTPREAECLTWAAKGKTADEISTILGRSRETVNFHLHNAVVKLDACNRTQAVAIACHRGWISVS